MKAATDLSSGKKKALYGLLFVISAAFPLLIHDQYFLHTAAMVLLYAFLAVAWNIVGGFVGQLSLGHAAYFGLGAYTSTLLVLQWHVSPWLGVIPAGLVAAAVGVSLGYPSFKVRGPYFALTTIAFAGILQIWIMSTESFLGLSIRGARGLMVPLLGNKPSMFQFMDKALYYWVILSWLIVLVLITYRLKGSRSGYYMEAVREDEDAAAATGINVVGIKLFANGLSAFFTGIAGVFYAQLILYVDPHRIMGIELSIEIALLAIIGGRGTLWGPILGAFLLRPVSEMTQIYLGGTYLGVHLSIYGLALMLAILYMPNGVLGLVKRSRQ
jgi:branched-chain amino acid transport system permease protein